MLPDCDGQAADAVSAYTQVKMEDAPRLLRIPESECPDVRIILLTENKDYSYRYTIPPKMITCEIRELIHKTSRNEKYHEIFLQDLLILKNFKPAKKVVTSLHSSHSLFFFSHFSLIISLHLYLFSFLSLSLLFLISISISLISTRV